MAEKIGALVMSNADECKAWLISFQALCRTKGIADITTKGAEKYHKTDKFLELCGTKALLKLISLLPGKDIEQTEFCDIKAAIKKYVEPRERLVIADRTHFLQISQLQNETEVDYLSRLNSAAAMCKWDDMKSLTSPNDEMVRLRFIAGLKDETMKLKVLEKLQLDKSASVEKLVEFCQMAKQLTAFVTSENESTDKTCENFHVSKAWHGKGKTLKVNSDKRSNASCKRCGTKHEMGKCPAHGKTCHKCGLANHFAKFCRSTKVVKQSEQTHKGTNSVDVFNVQSKMQNQEGLMQEVQIFDQTLNFQIDTGAQMSIMSEYQWNILGRPDVTRTDLKPTNSFHLFISTTIYKSEDTSFKHLFVE